MTLQNVCVFRLGKLIFGFKNSHTNINVKSIGSVKLDAQIDKSDFQGKLKLDKKESHARTLDSFERQHSFG